VLQKKRKKNLKFSFKILINSGSLQSHHLGYGFTCFTSIFL